MQHPWEKLRGPYADKARIFTQCFKAAFLTGGSGFFVVRADGA